MGKTKISKEFIDSIVKEIYAILDKSFADSNNLTEGEIAFQEIGTENKEKLGESTKPINVDKSFPSMAAKEVLGENTPPLIPDEQSDKMKKEYSTPGSFSTQHQIPGEMSNNISYPVKIDSEKEIRERTAQRENKEPYFEKGLDPNKEDEDFYKDLDNMLIEDEFNDIQKAHLITPKQNLAFGAKDLAEKIELDLYSSLRKAVNSWYTKMDRTTDLDDALVSLKKSLLKWNKDVSTTTLKSLQDLSNLGVKAGVRKTKIPLPRKFYESIEVISNNDKGIRPSVQKLTDDIYNKVSGNIKNHNMGSYRQKRAIDSCLRDLRPRTRLMIRTETAKLGNLGMLMAFNEDPEKYYYNYCWNNPLDKTTKDVSRIRTQESPYSIDEIIWLWKNQEQLINGKWQADQYNQRCSISRREKLDKEFKSNRFIGQESNYKETL